ncbi:X-Serrate-1 protein, partial [Aphelenchoides avenae]
MALRSSSGVLLLVFFPISLVLGGGQVELSVKEFSLSDAAACTSPDLCAIDLRFCIGTTGSSCGLIDKRVRLDSVAQLLAPRVLTANFTGRWNEAVVVTVDIRNASSQQLVMISRTFVALPPTENRLKSITTHSFGNRITFQVRVTCKEGFFGADCASYCPPPGPRDNFVCTPKGRQCLSGWNGADCKEPVCESGCEEGKCVAPNTCSCFPGWTGATCAECVPYNGCEKGYCTRPGTCVCRPNWTGRFCDKVVDKCAENPCANGGVCTSVEHDTFRCICPDGFAGKTCSEKVSPCATLPCGTNGVCINTGSSRDDYVCQCHEGFAGRNCERLQAAASNEPSVKMNITVNDITVTVHESSSRSAIVKKLDLLTVLIAVCI